jgi:hypothetical protein
MELLSLWSPIISYVLVHNQVLVHSDPIDVGRNRLRQGLPPSELQIYEPYLSPTFSSGILHFLLVALPSLIFNNSIN